MEPKSQHMHIWLLDKNLQKRHNHKRKKQTTTKTKFWMPSWHLCLALQSVYHGQPCQGRAETPSSKQVPYLSNAQFSHTVKSSRLDTNFQPLGIFPGHHTCTRVLTLSVSLPVLLCTPVYNISDQKHFKCSFKLIALCFSWKSRPEVRMNRWSFWLLHSHLKMPPNFDSLMKWKIEEL